MKSQIAQTGIGTRVLSIMLIVLGLASYGLAYPRACVPLELRCEHSDLIVVGKYIRMEVVSDEERKQIEPFLPSCGEQRENMLLARCTFEVTNTIKGNITPPAKASGEDSNKAQGEINAIAYFYNASGSWVFSCPPMSPSIVLNKSYLLLLAQIPGREEYYLAPDHEYPEEPTKERISQTIAAARPETWKWKKGPNGLEMTMIVRHYPLSEGDGRVEAVAAFRNRSEKKILLDMTNPSSLFVEVSDKKGQVTKIDKDIELGGVRLFLNRFHKIGKSIPDDGQMDTKLTDRLSLVRGAKHGEIPVEPGGMVLTTNGFNIELKDGYWKLRAGYKVQPGKTDGGEEFWSGTIHSNEVIVDTSRPEKKQ